MKNQIDTHYEILRVSRSASIGEIKDAYQARCMEFHPDHYKNINTTQCMRMLVLINEAYRVLRAPNLRQAYDYSLADNKEMLEDTLYADYNAIDYDIKDQEYFINQINSFAVNYMENIIKNSFNSNRVYFELSKQLYGQFYSIISTERYSLEKMKNRKTTNSK